MLGREGIGPVARAPDRLADIGVDVARTVSPIVAVIVHALEEMLARQVLHLLDERHAARGRSPFSVQSLPDFALKRSVSLP